MSDILEAHEALEAHLNFRRHMRAAKDPADILQLSAETERKCRFRQVQLEIRIDMTIKDLRDACIAVVEGDLHQRMYEDDGESAVTELAERIQTLRQDVQQLQEMPFDSQEQRSVVLKEPWSVMLGGGIDHRDLVKNKAAYLSWREGMLHAYEELIADETMRLERIRKNAPEGFFENAVAR